MSMVMMIVMMMNFNYVSVVFCIFCNVVKNIETNSSFLCCREYFLPHMSM